MGWLQCEVILTQCKDVISSFGKTDFVALLQCQLGEGTIYWSKDMPSLVQIPRTALKALGIQIINSKGLRRWVYIPKEQSFTRWLLKCCLGWNKQRLCNRSVSGFQITILALHWILILIQIKTMTRANKNFLQKKTGVDPRI